MSTQTLSPLSDQEKAAVRQRFERAVANLTETLQRDRTILAAIVGGSFSYDEVWEKSDIDLLIIGDETHKEKSFTLTEEDVNMHASVMPRSTLKKMVESSLASSFMHSFFSKTRLLYTHDDSLYALYENIQKVGERDKAALLLRNVSDLLGILAKAEKWLRVKRDYRYSFLYVLHCATFLAQLEVNSHNQIAGREVIQQAIKLNPDFFHRIYTNLIDGPKNETTLSDAIAAINDYLETRVPLIFQPILDFLAEADSPRSATEINEHFKMMAQAIRIADVCEWLSDKGIVEKVQLPLRLSPKSQVTVNEAGYYYGG